MKTTYATLIKVVPFVIAVLAFPTPESERLYVRDGV